ncbi:acetyltransferase [Methanobrevibacter sp. YE315]|uniref:GNAT family N-acetyltransferase n=1 Tax=Methanobrevibacter sp. YE315 TaxID=1609968 RepID=UPI000764D99E|nr:GNAT family N-acetyltransferase [Methanobrevibacter sp. YE315]AMD18275.1 acetyltransferase [Methanobrevibacter sp. YE315]
MIYENFNPKIHDAHKVAKLVYDVDFRTFDLLFKNQSKAISTIENDLKKHEPTSSFKVILDDNNEVIGMLVAYVSKMPRDLRVKSLKLIVVDILDYFVLCDIKKDDLYLAEIAIDSSLRGNGLGEQVLNDVIAYAQSKKLNRIILDADFRNAGAKHLYEKMGFKVFNKKRLKFGNFERGMYNMELIL